MRLMNRNKQPVYYMLYKGKEQVEDEYGNKSYRVTYFPPQLLMASVSSASGKAQTEMFGNVDLYDKVVITDDLMCKIDENSVLFIDKPPQFNENGSPLYDYIVKKVSLSLIHI